MHTFIEITPPPLTPPYMYGNDIVFVAADTVIIFPPQSKVDEGQSTRTALDQPEPSKVFEKPFDKEDHVSHPPRSAPLARNRGDWVGNLTLDACMRGWSVEDVAGFERQDV